MRTEGAIEVITIKFIVIIRRLQSF